MSRHGASYNPGTKKNYNFQAKDSTDLMAEEVEEEQTENRVVEHVPQSSFKSDADENEEPEEDPEEELEEDPEEGPAEDPEEELSEEAEKESAEEDPEEQSSDEAEEESAEENPEEEASDDPDEESAEEEVSAEESSKCVDDETKQLVEDPDEEALKVFTYKMPSQSDTDGTNHQSGSNHNHSKEKKRSLDSTVSDSDPLQESQSQKKFREEDAFNAESEVGSSVTDLHGKSVVLEDILNDESAAKQQEHTGSSGKRRRSRWEPRPEQDGVTDDGKETIKRRKTRWACDESQLKMLGPIQLPDMKALVESELDPKIKKLKLKLLEINTKLLSSDHDDRLEEQNSPSSQLVNTNLINSQVGLQEKLKLRHKLVKERQCILSKLIKSNPIFKPPDDYKPKKLVKKIYIPEKEFPAYNFVGIILGPRGNTQKRMELESGAKIRLRGKGSVKQKPDEPDEEDLHVYIKADNQKSLDAAAVMVEKLLIPLDEGMNEHKRAQLMELAQLNGTLRNDDNFCSVCKEDGHKHYACPNQQSTFEMVTTCATCGSFRHPTSRCPLMLASAQTKGKRNKEINDAHLYVGYLPQAVDEKWLRELFCPFGKITEVKVIRDQSTGLSKGYGFIKFESPNDAAMAVMHMNGHKMEGKMLAVRVAGRPPPPPQLAAAPVLPALNPIPMYRPAAIYADVTSQTTWSGPPGSTLPEADAVITLPSIVSSHPGSNLGSSYDSYYRYPNQIPFSSAGLLSQFPGEPDYPGSEFPSYFGTPTQTLNPSPPFRFSHTPESTANTFLGHPRLP